MNEALAVIVSILAIAVMLAIVSGYYFGTIGFLEYMDRKIKEWRRKQ